MYSADIFDNDDDFLYYSKEIDGEIGEWEGGEGLQKGLEAAIDMTDEEFDREVELQNRAGESETEDSEAGDKESESEEDGEDEPE